MVTRVNSSVPAVVTHSRTYAMPIIAVLAIAAIAYLIVRVARSLIGRVHPMSDPKNLHTQGRTDAKSKNYNEAISKYNLALQSNPGDELRADILYDRADVFCQINQLDDALTDYRAALKCTAETDFLALLHLRIAEVQAKKNEHGLSIQECTEALKLEHLTSIMKPTLLFKRACSHVVLDADEKAVEDFTAALDCKVEDNNFLAKILAHRAATYLKMKQIELARQDFIEAGSCDCDDMQLRRFIYIEKGRIYSSMGQHALAITDYEMALQVGEYDEHVFAQIGYLRGSSFSSLGRLDKAIADFTDANDYEFDNPNLRARILRARAMVYIEQQKLDDALKDLTDAIKCEPSQDLDQYLYLRALVLKNLKRYPEAIEEFTKAMEFHFLSTESKADLLHQRGIAHRENHSLDQARRDWEAALKFEISQNLREAINADLNPQTLPPAGKNSTFWGWVRSKIPGSSNN